MTRPARGLFRWAGGKKHFIERLRPVILAHRATTGSDLVSGFFGSGAVERACGGATIAADASPELLNLYEQLQQHGPAAVYQALLTLDSTTPREPAAYKALGLAGHEPGLRGAARFLWLSAMAFNGVWRVNSKGLFNMGVDRARLSKPTHDVLPHLDAFKEFAEQIRTTTFFHGWGGALGLARDGDILFVDPPYGEFVGYTAAGFDARDQRLLASFLREAVEQRGCALIAFNAPGAAPLYHWADVEVLTRSGAVSSKATERDPVAELLITAGLQL